MGTAWSPPPPVTVVKPASAVPPPPRRQRWRTRDSRQVPPPSLARCCISINALPDPHLLDSSGSGPAAKHMSRRQVEVQA